jgi:hypothetical protein
MEAHYRMAHYTGLWIHSAPHRLAGEQTAPRSESMKRLSSRRETVWPDQSRAKGRWARDRRRDMAFDQSQTRKRSATPARATRVPATARQPMCSWK